MTKQSECITKIFEAMEYRELVSDPQSQENTNGSINMASGFTDFGTRNTRTDARISKGVRSSLTTAPSDNRND